MEEQKKKRIEYIDVARGIAIIAMVISHNLEIDNLLRKIIFSFHMPIFIIISGYFYKDDTIKNSIKSILKSLIIPYVITLLILSMVEQFWNIPLKYRLIKCAKQIITSYTFAKDMKYGLWAPNVDVLWFIPMLALIRIIFIVLKKFFNEKEICGVFILMNFIGNMLGKKGLWLPLSLDIALASLIFYYVGYLLKKYDILNKLLKNWNVLITCFFIWILTIKFGYIELAIRSYPNGLFSFIGAIAGSVIIFKISSVTEVKLKSLSKILAWFGRNSILVLIIHYFERRIFIYNNMLFKNYAILDIMIKFIIVAICTFILERILKFIKSNKI